MEIMILYRKTRKIIKRDQKKMETVIGKKNNSSCLNEDI